MTGRRKAWMIVFLCVNLCLPRLQGQAPAVPAVPVVPATPAGVPAAPNNIWSFLCPTQAQCDKVKKCFCESIFGKMSNALLSPLSVYSGGLLSPCCPTADKANPDDLKKPADSASGAAARIKEDEANAKARRADVRYLGTVDCKRYPEAEKALINALRADRNECVRWEAAIALGHGCCCTQGTVEALKMCASGSDKDGNPAECSVRVRQEAMRALSHCQVLIPYNPEPPERPTPLPVNPRGPQEQPTNIPPQASLSFGGGLGNPQQLRLAQYVTPTIDLSAPSNLTATAASKQTTLPSIQSPRAAAPTPSNSAVAQNPPKNPDQTIPTGSRGLFHLLSRQFQP